MCHDVTPKLRSSARFNIEIPYDFVNPGFTKSHSSLDNMVILKTELLRRSCTTLGEIVRLYNYTFAENGFGQVWAKLG